MNIEMTLVNGLELPQVIQDLFEAGRWKMPLDRELTGRLFGLHDLGELCEVTGPILYSINQMRTETENWLNLSINATNLIGVADTLNPPGDIDPAYTVLIGDLGVGSDTPLALDFRASTDNPPVLEFDWDDDWALCRWIQICESTESFVRALNLS